jgi:3'-phosphoadenosine 5'-phosphosulfate sulfotransferase (PAPS reductase)/FAD synthetase
MKGGDCDGARPGKRVITPCDVRRARLRGFQRRVDRARRVIADAAARGQVGIAFSGGKDSTVLLHVVRSVIPNAPAAFYDSGCELPQTYDLVRQYGVTVIQPRMDLLAMCRYGGYWGYPDPTDADATFDFDEVLVKEPARRFAAEYGLAVMALGLRAGESARRALNAGQKGELYFAQYMNLWHLCPLAWWSTDDIWAYIAAHDLPYNVAYDQMAAMGITREQQRVCTLLGADAASFGRFVFLRRVAPDLWNRLAAEFPALRKYT